MIIDKYSFKQTEEYSIEVFTTLKELQSEFKGILGKGTVKEWVVNGDKEEKIIKGGKIKLYKKQ